MGAAEEDEQQLHRRAVEVADAVGAFIEAWGFRSIHGRVWAVLALSDRPLTQATLAERLGASRSHVHLAIGELQDLALVRPVEDRRNAPWEAEIDVWPIIASVLRKREWMLIESARLALEAMRLELDRRAGDAPPYRRERVELLLSMTKLAQAALHTLLELNVPASLPELNRWLERARPVASRLKGRIRRLTHFASRR